MNRRRPRCRPARRLESRRAARARRKDSPAIVASRALGEVFITVGVLMLLFVTYQLWWTNVLAGQEAGGAAQDLQDDRAQGRQGAEAIERADASRPGEGFAIMYIPKLDVRRPDRRGHHQARRCSTRAWSGTTTSKPVKTAMPGDKKGNFAVAGHRNTHGEPFRYINRLAAGDEIVVETQTQYYTYKMASILPADPAVATPA